MVAHIESNPHRTLNRSQLYRQSACQFGRRKFGNIHAAGTTAHTSNDLPLPLPRQRPIATECRHWAFVPQVLAQRLHLLGGKPPLVSELNQRDAHSVWLGESEPNPRKRLPKYASDRASIRPMLSAKSQRREAVILPRTDVPRKSPRPLCSIRV